MKRGFLIVLLSAVVGGLTAFGVVRVMSGENMSIIHGADSVSFRTVSLNHDNYPDFTYAAETCVDAVVYVKVSATQTIQQNPGSIFDFFFGFPQQGAPKQRDIGKRKPFPAWWRVYPRHSRRWQG